MAELENSVTVATDETDAARTEIQGEINALKSLLVDSDYKANKLIESLVETMYGANAMTFISKFISWITTAITEFGEAMSERAAYRDRINELEKMLDEMDATQNNQGE